MHSSTLVLLSWIEMIVDASVLSWRVKWSEPVLRRDCIRSRSENFFEKRDDLKRRAKVRRVFSFRRAMSLGDSPFTTVVAAVVARRV